MDYNMDGKKIKGQICGYKPYQGPRKQRMSAVSIALRCILAALIVAVVIIFACRAEDVTTTCWVLCKPGDHVNLRIGPGKGYSSVGWLEIGDDFTTDGEKRNGWIRVLDRGECECWIFGGYVVEVKPEAIGETRYVAAKKQLACRRWVNGPQIKGREWLKNGREVQVFYVAGEWAVTNLGYVEAGWLEV